jgi:hypothetical protein
MSNDTAIAATSVADWRNDSKLSEKWKFRFAFFEKYGAPAFWVETPEQRAALKQMPFGARIKIRMNGYAFFFGIIYYAFFLKLWRQALILLGIGLAYGIVANVFDLSGSADRGFSVVYGMFCAVRANVLYYLKRTKGDIGWKI